MIKFIYRLIKHLLILLFVLLPLEIIGWAILLPIVYYNQRSIQNNMQYSLKLPYLFRWFDNADIYSEFNRDSTTYLCNVVPKGVLYRYYWLAFRNPINYFGYKVLGFQWKDPLGADLVNNDIGDSVGQQAGLSIIGVTLNNKKYYEYYFIYKWSQTKCLRFRLGWKLQNTKNNDWVQWVLVFQPYRSYGGL